MLTADFVEADFSLQVDIKIFQGFLVVGYKEQWEWDDDYLM